MKNLLTIYLHSEMRRVSRHIAMLALMLIVAACSSNDGAGGGLFSPSDDEILLKVGPEPEYLPPYKGGTNNKSYVVLGNRYRVMDTSKGYDETGLASWYGDKFHGNPTSIGETYDMYEFTAAHKSLPLPTFVRVTNLSNNRSLIVKVNDRGPFVDDRIIDLSYAAATKLGTKDAGVVRVRVRAVGPYQYRTQALAEANGADREGSSSADDTPAVPSSSGYEIAETLSIEDTAPVQTPLGQSTANIAQPLSANNQPIQLQSVSVEQSPEPLVQQVVEPVSQPLGRTPVQVPTAQAPSITPVSQCVAGQKRCLQIGVFASRENAQRTESKVVNAVGGRTEIQPTQRNGQTMYRVLVGPMQYEEFEPIAQAIHQSGVYGRFVNF